ncbi:MAG: sulfatase family protein, partial [Solirubrobacterales bacterium]
AAACALGVLGGAPGVAAGGPQARPNIVVVLTDDQTLEQFNARTMPFTHRTLGQGGTRFTDSVVTSPLCCPSRASSLTGSYTHNHGAWNSYKTFERPSEQLASWLGRDGYRTAMIGKYLNHYEEVASSPTKPGPGWDRWRMLLEPLSYYDYDVSVDGRFEHRGFGDGDYATTYLNRQAVRTVRRWAPRDRPFFLWYAPHAPHDEKGRSKGSCAGRAVPAPGDEDLFRNADLPRPPSFNERQISDKPAFMRDLPRLRPREVDELTRIHRCRLASLREVDRGVADIVRELRASHELDDTAIVFTSDNGLFHGEHRLRDGKRLPYREAVEVPLVARIPDPVAGGAVVSKVPAPVANIDLAPTLLELAEADACLEPGTCRTMDGRSMVPLLLGNAGAWPADRARLLEMRNCRYSGLLADQQLVVHHAAVPREPTEGGCIRRSAFEHYRLDEDPFQLRNRADRKSDFPDPLRQRLNRAKDCIGVAGRDPAPPVGSSYCE